MPREKSLTLHGGSNYQQGLMKQGLKACTKCEKVKPLSEYHRHVGVSNRIRPACKECINAQNLARKASPEAQKGILDQHLKRYGMNSDDFYRLLNEQNGLCAICETDDPGAWFGRMVVDHSHVTGKVRGLLCAKCNRGIGQFNDKIDLLRKALAYLERTGE